MFDILSGIEMRPTFTVIVNALAVCEQRPPLAVHGGYFAEHQIMYDRSGQVIGVAGTAGQVDDGSARHRFPDADGTGRVPAVEVLVNTERVAERIADPALTHEIPDLIAEGAFYGMETFDQSILRLASTGRVTFEEGFRHATKPADLKLRAQQLGLLGT
jgi:hypothetical protein